MCFGNFLCTPYVVMYEDINDILPQKSSNSEAFTTHVSLLPMM